MASVLQLNADDGGGSSHSRVVRAMITCFLNVPWASLASVDLDAPHAPAGHDAPRAVLSQDEIVQWMRQASEAGAWAIGLCELNGWQMLGNGYLDSSAARTATPLIVSRAASAGFAFSHIFHPSGHPYALGLVAATEIRVIREVGPPAFERGMLHVRLPELGLDLIIVHLHAHDARKRDEEV